MTAAAITSASLRMAQVAREVPAHALGRPTPCDELTVGDLLDHIFTFCGVFTGAAEKDLAAAASPGRPPSVTRLPDDWRTVIPQRLARLAEAWSDPHAWTGTTIAGKLPAPGELAGAIALDELVVHGWDLARATGQAYDVDRPTLELVRAFIEDQVGDDKPIPRSFVFAPVIATSPDASLLDRVIALAGRDPEWHP